MERRSPSYTYLAIEDGDGDGDGCENDANGRGGGPLIDFSNYVEPRSPSRMASPLSKVVEYDYNTAVRYKILRKRKMDPFMMIDVDEDVAFKFGYRWDPYTGERLDELDQDGPFYFDPDVLVHFFYSKRLSKLWVDQTHDVNGVYQGYYDDGVGAGEEFFVPSRGPHPEYYLFRLPIPDCYLTKTHNKQFITFGPKLTLEEIMEIDAKAGLRPDNYKNWYRRERPSLVTMKAIYDLAIAQEPPIVLSDGTLVNELSESQRKIMFDKVNRKAVDALIQFV